MFKKDIVACISLRKHGIIQAFPSYCTANMLVIEAILEFYKKKNSLVLIEATANQVNQFGGYTGMSPQDYKYHVYEIANKIGFDSKNICLAGDHLGPLPWAHLPAQEAMKNAHELVRQFVLAGYEKIHLDTSIKLADDDLLTDEIIAQRGAALYKTCLAAWKELKFSKPDTPELSFVIGSEVPPAGGNTGEAMRITSPVSLESTIKAYQKSFNDVGLESAWDSIVAIVVQPGVEYSNFTIYPYNRKDAAQLCDSLKKYPQLCFEGHSTDFQTSINLRKMAEDGISILKVGPALTFALREALFNLCHIEQSLITDNDKCSHFRTILLEAMQAHPQYWEKYYHGTSDEMIIQAKFSYLDRSRYYLSKNKVSKAIKKLIDNIDSLDIPGSVLHQYFPMQYYRLYSKGLCCDAKNLIFDYIAVQLEEYEFASEIHKIY